jgi:hypothetical protein
MPEGQVWYASKLAWLIPALHLHYQFTETFLTIRLFLFYKSLLDKCRSYVTLNEVKRYQWIAGRYKFWRWNSRLCFCICFTCSDWGKL